MRNEDLFYDPHFKLIKFDTGIAKHKPENVITGRSACPFCHPETLSGIVAAEDDMILLKNKYNVVIDAEQFVLVEAAACDNGIEKYSHAKNRQLWHFAIRHYEKMLADPRYKSVILFKNHGPLSGGTMRHPHMQLIGFHSIEPVIVAGDEKNEFDGPEIARRGTLKLLREGIPRLGFSEFTIVSEYFPLKDNDIDDLAFLIKATISFLVKNDRRDMPSYNIFFYNLIGSGRLAVRILPRYATSPLFIGYDLRVLPDNGDAQAAKLREQIDFEETILQKESR